MASASIPDQSNSRKRKSRGIKDCDTKSRKTKRHEPADQDKSKYFSVPTLTKGSDKHRLKTSFYDVPCEDLAKAMLGKTLVRISDGKRLSGKIVETEAYIGPIDKAAHSYNGKKTDRNSAMFMTPGTAYVYNIYGMYCCLNISSKGDGAAVLIRALEPLENLEVMDKFRSKTKEKSLMKKAGVGLCNGPSKLCQALDIKKDAVNKLDMSTSDVIWLEEADDIGDDNTVKCKRINIDYAEDWVDKPLRFYIHGNSFVSVRDKLVEKDMKKS